MRRIFGRIRSVGDKITVAVTVTRLLQPAGASLGATAGTRSFQMGES